jgi:hypothetical protein
MKNIRLMLAACLLLPLALGACQKEEAAVAVDAPVAVPTTNDDNAWNAYLTDVVRRNMDGATNTYVYVLPAPDNADFQGSYDRQLAKAQGDIERGILENTLIAFGSPNSEKTGNLAVASFERAEAGKMKGVKVVFVGNSADSARVQAAVEPSGATYKFVEAK